MGSHAYSLHIKHNDAEAVSAAIASVLRDAGYVSSEARPDPHVAPFMGDGLRSVKITAPHGGWIGVMDSSAFGQPDLAAPLSTLLGVPAVNVWVNDSDSWHYQYFDAGKLADEFNSRGDEEGDFITDSFAPEETDVDPERLMQSMAEFKSNVEEEVPEEIRAIQARLQESSHSREDLETYKSWMQHRFDAIQPMLNSMGISMPGADWSLQKAQEMDASGSSFESVPISEPDGSVDYHKHLALLRPLLSADFDDQSMLEILARKDVFAEQTLADFLPLVGIHPEFAYLSYAYATDEEPSDPAKRDITIAQHLAFARHSRR